MAGKLSHLGYTRKPAADGYRWYKDGVRVKAATVERAKRSVDAYAAREVRRAARPVAPAVREARAADRAREVAAVAREAATERALLRPVTQRLPPAARRPERAPAPAPAPAPPSAPVEIKSSFYKYRGADGRFLSKADVDRMTPRQRARAGVKRETHVRTFRGAKGKRLAPLVKALREAEEEGKTWDRIPDHYFRRARDLALIDPDDDLAGAAAKPAFESMGRRALLQHAAELEVDEDAKELTVEELRDVVSEAWDDSQ
jgi:hypothetical protein